MKKKLKFRKGKLVSATLDAIICQEGATALHVENAIEGLGMTLWEKSSKPQVFWVGGWLPVVVQAKTSLDYNVTANAKFKSDPLFTGAFTVARRYEFKNGQEPYSDNIPNRNIPEMLLESGSVEGTVHVSSALIPKLEVVLYGVGGPFIKGSAMASADWHTNTGATQEKLDLSLGVGLSHRIQSRDKRLSAISWRLYECTWRPGGKPSKKPCISGPNGAGAMKGHTASVARMPL